MPKSELAHIDINERMDDSTSTVDLSSSQLTQVPVKLIASYKTVVCVNLSKNKIMSLGVNISLLAHLTKLNLSYNKLKYLPSEFGCLRNLEYLDISCNQLVNLPLSFGNLQHLKFLNINGNPLPFLVMMIAGPFISHNDCFNSAVNTVQFFKHASKVFNKFKGRLGEADIHEKVIREIYTKCRSIEKTKAIKSKIYRKDIHDFIVNSTCYINYDIDFKSKTALKTLLVFFILLAINIFIVYKYFNN